MNQRKPSFTQWDNLGPCVIYPVSVHVNGRQWEDKNILVPLQAWREGIRKFGFVNSFGVTPPEYTVTPKVEKSLINVILACHSFYKKLEEMRRLQDELDDMRDKLNAMGHSYELPWNPMLNM